MFLEAVEEGFSLNNASNQVLDKIKEQIYKTFRDANSKILTHTGNYPDHAGMGCTAELLTFNGSMYALGHVGDSRTYLYRKDNLKQLTKDHSLVQSQMDEGAINKA